MLARPIPRSVLGVAVAAIALLAACGGQERQPDGYGSANPDGEGYYGNFMYGCTGVEPVDGRYLEPVLESQQFCRCVYDGMQETVPFADAAAFEEAQAEAEPGNAIEVPSSIASVQEACENE